MPFAREPRPETSKSLSGASPIPFWLDDPSKPESTLSLQDSISADLVIVGAGFTGLWAALLAKEADPSREVMLLEAEQVGSGASGRNGGFMEASLTHGFFNGFSRWPKEMSAITAMGYSNLEEIEATVRRFGIDCDFIHSGELLVATEPYQVEDLRSAPKEAAAFGEKYEWMGREQIQLLVNSPIYRGALYDPRVVMVNPARLAWGLRKACLDTGVQLYENTPATQLEEDGKSIQVQTTHGSVRAAKVALATNAYTPLLKEISNYMVPVYDYALMTEPLSAAQRAEIGWQARQGISDTANQFHYYRMTEDGRILWGGYDAVYYKNNGVGQQYDANQESFGLLAEHFFETFPQLEGLRFTHAWGGAIDTCSRFSVFWGTAHGGRTAYAAGYTGLGVAASRFGAQIMLDLLDHRDNERTRLSMVREKPVPFPPEPMRSWVVEMTRRSLDQADRNHGHRNLWLRTLDSMGLGYDS